MGDILRQIEAYKRREIADAKVRMPFKTLERNAPLWAGALQDAIELAEQRSGALR